MRMNSGIILAGQQPDVIGTVARGHAAGRQAGLADLFREQGAGIAQGDEGALNALAAFDPNMALGVKGQQQQMAHADQRMAMDRERMDMLRASARERAAAASAGLSAAQRAEAAEQLKGVLMGASTFYKQGNEQGYNEWLQKNGADPAQFPMSEFPAHAAMVLGSMDALVGPKPLSGPGKIQADIDAGILPPDTPLGGAPLVDMSGANFGPQPPAGQNPQSTNTPRDADKLSTKLSENDAAFLAAENERARSAGDIQSLATQLETVAPNVGYTGPGGALYGAVDDAIGVLPGDSGARGAFRSLAMEAQLAFTEKTKGAITDREMGMFKEAVPNLGQRPEANAKIAQVMRAGAERTRSRASFFENWARKHGSIEGAEEVWSEFIEDNPIIVPDGKGSITVRPDKDWAGYLNRMPAASYTPQTIMQMSRDELSQVPIERMTEQQLNALELRMQQVGQ